VHTLSFLLFCAFLFSCDNNPTSSQQSAGQRKTVKTRTIYDGSMPYTDSTGTILAKQCFDSMGVMVRESIYVHSFSFGGYFSFSLDTGKNVFIDFPDTETYSETTACAAYTSRDTRKWTYDSIVCNSELRLDSVLDSTDYSCLGFFYDVQDTIGKWYQNGNYRAYYVNGLCEKESEFFVSKIGDQGWHIDKRVYQRNEYRNITGITITYSDYAVTDQTQNSYIIRLLYW